MKQYETIFGVNLNTYYHRSFKADIFGGKPEVTGTGHGLLPDDLGPGDGSRGSGCAGFCRGRCLVQQSGRLLADVALSAMPFSSQNFQKKTKTHDIYDIVHGYMFDYEYDQNKAKWCNMFIKIKRSPKNVMVYKLFPWISYAAISLGLSECLAFVGHRFNGGGVQSTSGDPTVTWRKLVVQWNLTLASP